MYQYNNVVLFVSKIGEYNMKIVREVEKIRRITRVERIERVRGMEKLIRKMR